MNEVLLPEHPVLIIPPIAAEGLGSSWAEAEQSTVLSEVMSYIRGRIKESLQEESGFQ